MYRKNVASQFIYFGLVNATDGSALTGATVSARRCIDGTFAAGGGTVTEDTGLGWYKYAMSQADTNGNDIGFYFTATNAIPVSLTILTTAADPSDSVRLGLTALPNAAAGANTGLPVVGTQVPNATAGASGGLLISGSNSGTTTLGALTVTGATTLAAVSATTITASGAVAFQSTFAMTGNVSMAAGFNITQSSSNTSALVITGNGTGHGAAITSGSGVTGNAVTLLSASTNGHGFKSTGTGTGDGMELTAGASGADLDADIAGTLTTVTTAVNVTTVNGLAANVITAAATATDFGTEMATAIWTDAVAGDFTVASSIGKALYIANIVPGASGGHFISGSNAGTTTVGALTVTGATTLTGAVTATNGSNSITGVTATVTGTVTVGTNNDKTGYALSASGVDAIWDEPLAAHTTADTPGQVLNMLTQDTVTLSSDVALGSIIGQLLDNGTSWSYDRATDSLEAQRDNLGTNGAAIVLAKTTNITGFNDIAATAVVSSGAITTSGGAVSTVTTTTTATNLTNAPTNGDFTATMKTSIGTAVAASAVASVTGDIGGLAAGAITDVEDAVWDAVLANHLDAGSTGFALNAAGSAGDPWATTLPGAYGAGTAGHIVGTALPDIAPGSANGLLRGGSNAATTFATLTSTGAMTVGSIVNNGVTDVAQTGDSFARIGATGSALTSLAPSATALSNVQWTNARAGYLDNINNANLATVPAFPSNFASMDINATGGVGIDWANVQNPTTTLNLSGTTVGTVTASSDKTGYALTAAAYNAAADAIIARNIGGGSSTGRTVEQALATIRNKVTIVGTTMTVFDTDDTTPLYTSTLTTDADAEPITASAPTT